LVLKNVGENSEYTDLTYSMNPFGCPQMLPDNWRQIAYHRSDATGSAFIEICKKLKG